MQVKLAEAVRAMLASAFAESHPKLSFIRSWRPNEELKEAAAAMKKGEMRVYVVPEGRIGNDTRTARDHHYEREIAIDVGLHVKLPNLDTATVDAQSDLLDQLRQTLWGAVPPDFPGAKWLRHQDKLSVIPAHLAEWGVYSGVFASVYKISARRKA